MYYGKFVNHFINSALWIYLAKKKYVLVPILTFVLVLILLSPAVAAWDCLNDERQYIVVIDHEEQYSIWPADREIPPGWKAEGTEGTKQECLDHIERVWMDMRPLSLRKEMEEQVKESKQKTRPIDSEKVAKLDIDAMKRWVSYLTWMVKVGQTFIQQYPETAKCILSQTQKDTGKTLTGLNHRLQDPEAYGLSRPSSIDRSKIMNQREQAKKLNGDINKVFVSMSAGN
jgi:MbtH protein